MKTGRKIAVLATLVALLVGGQLLAAEEDERGPLGGGPRFGRPGRPGPGIGGPAGPMRGPGLGLGGPGGGPGEIGLERVIGRLDLTEEQREAIKGIRDGAAEQAEAAHDAVRAAQEALHDLIVAGGPEAEIREAAAALGKAIGDQAVLRAGTAAAIKNVLTDEQRERIEQWQARAAEWRERAPDAQRLGRMRGSGPVGPGRGIGPGPGGGFGPGMGPGRGPQLGWGPGRGVGPGPGAQLGMGPGRGPNIERLFDRCDANEDGKLTPEEVEQAGRGEHPRLERLFEEADTDQDGALTVDEIKAFGEQVRERGRRPRP